MEHLHALIDYKGYQKNRAAVWIGVVNRNLLKYRRVIRKKITGAPMACTISVVSMDMRDIPINMIAPQSAHPSNPRDAMIRICLRRSCMIVFILSGFRFKAYDSPPAV